MDRCINRKPLINQASIALDLLFFYFTPSRFKGYILFLKLKSLVTNNNDTFDNLPNHVGIIMDGNGRWAKARGLNRLKGHQEGVKNVRKILSAAQTMGIKYLTLYAFSTENWKRPLTEVKALHKLLDVFIKRYSSELVENEVCFNVIGRYQEFPKSIVSELNNTIERTKHFKKNYLTLALNYSSRTEVVDATKRYLEAIREGKESLDKLDWEIFRNYLDTKDLPYPDLIIRTSGECRLSNFLLLQGAYAEIVISPVFWPEFTEKHFNDAIEAFKSRERRFGKTSDQIKQSI